MDEDKDAHQPQSKLRPGEGWAGQIPPLKEVLSLSSPWGRLAKTLTAGGQAAQGKFRENEWRSPRTLQASIAGLGQGPAQARGGSPLRPSVDGVGQAPS